MKILDRYIALHVLGGTLAALAVLTALFTVIEFVDDLGDVGKGSYGLGSAFLYSALRLPARILGLMPLAGLIGALLGLGLLVNHRELVVMRAAGVSVGRITVSVLRAGLVVVALAVILGEVVVPRTEPLAEEHRSFALTSQLGTRTASGYWLRDGLSFINIRRVLPESELRDVHIYEFDEQRRLRVASRARRARFVEGRWHLENVVQSVLGPEGVLTRRIGRAEWRSVLDPEQVSVITVTPEALSLVGLARYIGYLRDNGLETARYEVALWNKLVSPIATGVLIFVGVVLVLGPLERMSTGQRSLVGILLGIGFHILQRMTTQMGLVFEGSPFLSVVLPVLAFLALGLWMLRRIG